MNTPGSLLLTQCVPLLRTVGPAAVIAILHPPFLPFLLNPPSSFSLRFPLFFLLPPQSPHTPPSHQMNLQHLLQHLPDYDYAQPNSRRTLFGLTVRRPPKLHLLKSSLPSMAWGGWKNCRENLDRPRVSLMSRHTGEFSLSANEKPRMRPAIVHFNGPHRPRRSPPLINFGLKAPWSPRSSARRRLERLRAGRGHCPPVCCSYGVPILKIKPPLNIILNIID